MDALMKINRKLLPEVAKVVLEELVELKKKEQKLEKAKGYWALFTLAVIGSGIFYVYYFKMHGTSILSGSPIDFFVGDWWMKGFIVAIAFSLTQVKMLDKKYNKAEKEFEELRNEIIERSTELWSDPEQWDNRHQVFEVLKKEHDINLYHRG